MKKKAVILLSGGLDSTTVLALAKSQGYTCYTLSFRYGQKHTAELAAAERIATQFQVDEHKIIDIDLENLVGSKTSLLSNTLDVPDYQASDEIPNTYVPARNTIFLSFAMGWAEVLEANNIFIGVSQVDYSGYPDCRQEFIDAFATMANLATKAGVEGQGLQLHTPLINRSKAETIQLGHSLGVDYAQTVSCYKADAKGRACGKCDSCVLRKQGFAAAQVVDTTQYAE